MARCTVAAAALLLGGALPVAADEIIDQIEQGKQYYVEGDYAAAITEFEFALNTVREKLSALFMATMPDPPALWSADEAMLDAGAELFGGGFMVTRDYREQTGAGKVKAELVVDSPMIQVFAAVRQNPVMIRNEPRTERVRLGRMNALLTWNQEDRSGDIATSIGGRVLAKLQGDGLRDKSVLIELMRTWDLDAVRDVAGL